MAWKLEGLRGLDDFAAAGDGAARADGGDEDVDLAVGVGPELFGRGLRVEWPDSRDFQTAAASRRSACWRRVRSALAMAPFMP
jgi:hypothetical protein